MKIRKEYMVKYVDDVPYLLPYGQGIAQKFYGLRLDSDEVFLWELIQEHYDEIGCVHEMAEHKNIPPENQDAVEQKVANFFEILEQYNIIERNQRKLIGPLEDHDLFEIAGMTLMYNGPKEYIPAELEPYRMASAMQPVNWEDASLKQPKLRADVVFSPPRLLGIGEILIRTHEVIIYADERHYYYLFPYHKSVHEMRIRKDGSKSVIFAYPSDATDDLIVHEVNEALYQSFLVFALCHDKYAFSSLSLQYGQKGYLFIENEGEHWSELIRQLSDISHVMRCNHRTCLLEMVDDGVLMWNIPWGNVAEHEVKQPLHLGGVVLLHHGDENRVEDTPASDNILFATRGMVSPMFSKQFTEENIDFCVKLEGRVPMWHLVCNESQDTLEFIRKVVDKG